MSQTISAPAPVLRFARPSLLVFWFFLLALFVTAAFGWSFFLWGGEALINLVSGKSKPPPPAPLNFEAFPRLPDTLESKLREAFDPTLTWGGTEIADPFMDRAGLTGAKVDAGKTLPAPKPNALAALLQPGAIRPPQPLPPATPTPTPVITPQEKAETAERALASRLEERQRQMREGRPTAPLPAYYGWEDVHPLGSVGDAKTREVMFYSHITRQTFAAGPGSKFFDAEFLRFNENGVFFRVGQREEFAGWTRINDVAARAAAKAAALPPALPRPQPSPTPSESVKNPYGGLQEAVRNRYPARP
jgi:hypothetical protein